MPRTAIFGNVSTWRYSYSIERAHVSICCSNILGCKTKGKKVSCTLIKIPLYMRQGVCQTGSLGLIGQLSLKAHISVNINGTEIILVSNGLEKLPLFIRDTISSTDPLEE